MYLLDMAVRIQVEACFPSDRIIELSDTVAERATLLRKENLYKNIHRRLVEQKTRR